MIKVISTTVVLLEYETIVIWHCDEATTKALIKVRTLISLPNISGLLEQTKVICLIPLSYLKFEAVCVVPSITIVYCCALEKMTLEFFEQPLKAFAVSLR